MPGLQNSVKTLDYLGNIGGTDRGDSLRLSKSAQSLLKLAGLLIETASDNLEASKHVSTGNTISSMKVVNADLKAPVMSVDIQILKTYKFIDQGVKGTRGGAGKYAFKNEWAGKKMRAAIEKWLRTRSKRAKTYPSKYRPYSTKTQGKGGIEQKDVGIKKKVDAAKSMKSLAWAVSVAIKRKGIPRTLFFTKAIKETQKKAKKVLGEGLKLDIIESIK